ncbi:MAG: sulfurtransferase [Deltaproteobacteria bacterium]|nr:sulfurtransferase [Deltaproteobacteria bacterium]
MVDLIKLFTPVESLDPEQAKDYVASHEEGTYTLLDVRQPSEYEESHIPGAKLAPLPQLSDSLNQLDKSKPTLVYCAVGGRSRVAAQLLAGRGFKHVYNLKGGIKAWLGQTAEGPQDLDLDLIPQEETPEGIFRVSFGMESVLAEFYRSIAEKSEDSQLAGLLLKLASVEEKHKEYLRDLYRSLTSSATDTADLESQACVRMMEGGFEIHEFTRKYEPFLKKREDLLDLSMMLETQALDLYLRFSDKVSDEKSKQMLFKIADEEKGHLAALGRLREETLASERQRKG